MLISPANQLTLVPFCDGTSRSYLMVGSIFVYLYSYIYIYGYIYIVDICLAIYSAMLKYLLYVLSHFNIFHDFHVAYLVKKRWMFFIKS